MLDIATNNGTGEQVGARAAYKVDPTAGVHDGTVSQQWMSRPYDQRYLSLDDLWAATNKRHEASFETRSRNADIEIIAPAIEKREDMHKLRVGVAVNTPTVREVREVAPTHYAFGQLAGLAKAPAGFLRELPSPMVSDIMNWRLKYAREVEELKLYGGADELYAATGPDYGRIPDHQVVEAVRQVAGSGRGERRWKIPGVLDWSTSMYDPEASVTKDSTTLYASDRDVFMFLVDDRNPVEVGKTAKGDPDLMFRGFYVQNSEVGARSLKLAAFYLRAVCMNRNLWGVEGFEDMTIRHTRLAPDRWLQQAQPALRSYAEGSSAKLVDGVAKAKAAKLADDDDAALAFLKGRNFSNAAARSIMETSLREEDRPVRSAWDMAQAMTAYARALPNTDDRLGVEIEAKRVLDKFAA